MQSQVLVPLDGSIEAEMILLHALFLAQQAHSMLTLLRVIVPPIEPLPVSYIPDDRYDSEVSWTRQYLSDLARRLQVQGVCVQAQYVENVSASAAIITYAEQHPDVRLIALATHGRDAAGRLFLGSVAEHVFASAPTSLLLLHPPKDAQLPPGPIPRASYQSIVVPLNGTALSERVLEPATTLAQRDHASVLAVQTAIAGRGPKAFIEGLAQENQQKLLIVALREQAEHKVMRFLHQSNVPVLFVTL
jgi:nucleotide-binding universal stress UspA family protein